LLYITRELVTFIILPIPQNEAIKKKIIKDAKEVVESRKKAKEILKRIRSETAKSSE
jgi:hypothetical protein